MTALARMDDFVRSEDPSEMGYPATFPMEVALRTAPIRRICEAYGFSRDDWDRMRGDPVFIDDLQRCVDEVKKDGMSFKMKARLQADELLKTSWSLIHSTNDTVPPNVKADLIKATVRWAGLEQDPKAQGTVGNALQINIQLG